MTDLDKLRNGLNLIQFAAKASVETGEKMSLWMSAKVLQYTAWATKLLRGLDGCGECIYRTAPDRPESGCVRPCDHCVRNAKDFYRREW